jgi:hypothetical protein
MLATLVQFQLHHSADDILTHSQYTRLQQQVERANSTYGGKAVACGKDDEAIHTAFRDLFDASFISDGLRFVEIKVCHHNYSAIIVGHIGGYLAYAKLAD